MVAVNNATSDIEDTVTLSNDNTNFMSSIISSVNAPQYDEIDFGELFMKYKRMRDSFKREYKLWEIFMMFRLFILFWMIWFWIENAFGNEFTLKRDVVIYIGSGCLCFILPFIEYIIGGSQLNQQYTMFNDSLWEYDMIMDEDEMSDIDEKFDVSTLPGIDHQKINPQLKYDKKMRQSLLSRCHGNRFDGSDHKHEFHNTWNNAYDYIRNAMINIKEYQFMLQYCNKYPFKATLYGYNITILNAFLFFMTLVIIKLISYSILGYDRIF